MERKQLFVVSLVVLLMVLVSCQQLLSPPDQAPAVMDAEARTTEVINRIIGAKATGDYTELEALLAEDDPQGELRGILAENGVFTPEAVAKGTPVTALPLPWFTSPPYQTGDVLVSKGSGALTSNLMDLILVAGYSHAGILKLESAIVPDSGCILSADVDYLLEGGGNALNYETWAEWVFKNDVITVLHPKQAYSDLLESINKIAEKATGTIYAFLGYPGAVVGAFQPIPRENDKYWYCSKVPWRVYDRLPVDIEEAAFYGQSGRWQLFQTSVLYKVYLFYLKLLHPYWPWSWIKYAADQQLKYILTKLITPDELRVSGELTPAFMVHRGAAGPVEVSGDGALVGWPIPY